MHFQPNRHAKSWWALVFIMAIIGGFGLPSPVRAENSPIVPAGFDLVGSNLGIEFYRRNYSGGSPDYVQIVHLNLGASVRLLHGDITDSGSGRGAYGGNDARFVRKSIGQFWNDAVSTSSAAFCVSNGQFFKMAESPARLPFSLKRDGQVLTDGYGINEFPGQKLMLEIWSDRVDIRELSAEALYNSGAPNIVAGLTEDAEKASKKAVGRTFIGINDEDSNGQSEILMVFNTRTAKPSAAADVLRSFGADQVMMLDGGGSTQLICQGNILIDTERAIPQGLATFAATGPVYAANFSRSAIANITEGVDRRISVRAANTGTATWTSGISRLALSFDTNQMQYFIDLTGDVQPGEAVELIWEIPNEFSAGTYQADIALVNGDQHYTYQPGAITFTILPLSQSDPSAARGGAGISPSTSEKAWLSEWFAERFNKPEEPELVEPSKTVSNLPRGKVEFGNIIWVPLFMFPLLAFVIIIVMNIQRSNNLYID